MKQPISRSPFTRTHGTVAVYLQEGAPLTDAVWNEAVDTAWTELRGVVLDSGLQGTAGPELRVEPILDATTGDLLDLVLRGGPGRFYNNGLPVAWPADLRFAAQRCGCAGAAVGEVVKGAGFAPVFVWLETRAVFLDEGDLPALRDPAVQAERGSFRRAIRSCVRVAEAQHIPGALVGPLTAIDAVAPLLKGIELPAPPPDTNLRLTVQGAYAGDENLHYHVEMVGPRGQLDKYTHLVELLWDDMAAATVTRLASDAEPAALEIEVHSAEGFEPGHYIRLEGDGVDAQVYEITGVDGHKLGIRRSLCCEVRSLAGAPIVAQQVIGDPARPALLKLKLTIVGACELVVGDLVTDLSKRPDAPALPFSDQVWKVLEVGAGDCADARAITLVPHFGLTAALGLWGPPLDLMQQARIHEHCVVVEEAACWQPGMKIRISGRPRELAVDDPCWRPDELDEGHECWPTREPLFRDELRTITWIERCGAVVDCCDSEHTTMTLRLDVPLAADHSKCCDDVRAARDIKVRRYAGHECGATLQALWPCCAATGGVCCLKPSFTLPSGLEVVLTYRGGTTPHFAAGDAWTFAARAGGWYEDRVFAPPFEPLLGLSPLAVIVRTALVGPQHNIHDLRPIPAAFDQTALLAEVAQSCAELATYFAGTTSSWLKRAAQLAGYPRVQADVRHGTQWQFGLAQRLYAVARDFLWTHQGQKQLVTPELLTKNPLLAVAFVALANATRTTRHRPSLTDRELATIAAALRRAATTAAAIVAGCCGGEGDPELLTWPPLHPLETSGPSAPKWLLAPPICPDEHSEPEPEPDPDPDPSDEDDFPLGDDEPEPEPEPEHEFPLGDPEPEPEPDPGFEHEFPLGDGEPEPDPDPNHDRPIAQPEPAPQPDPDPPIAQPEPAPQPDPLPLPNPPIGVPVPNPQPIPGGLINLGDISTPDLGIADLLARTPDVPDELAHIANGEPVDLMRLASDQLQILQTLNPSTAHRIAADWPTLADVFHATSEGSVRRQVIANLHAMVGELRDLLARDDAPGPRDRRLRAIWSRYLRAPVPEQLRLAPTLPAPPSRAHEEE